MSLLFQGRSARVAAYVLPIAFLGIVTLVAMRCGVAAGVLGSAAAAVIFAMFLFAPLGSLQIENKSARADLAWLFLGALTLSYLLGSTPGGHQTRS